MINPTWVRLDLSSLINMDLILFTVCYGFLPLGLFFLWRNDLSWKVSYFLPFIILVFAASLYELVGSAVLRIPVKYWFTLYNYLVFFVLFHFFYRVLKGDYKLLFAVFSFLFIANTIFVALAFSVDDVLAFGPYFKGLQTVFILTFSTLWFRQRFRDADVYSLLDEPAFYFLSGLILYYCGTFFLFLLSNFMYLNDQQAFDDLWIINVLLNIVLRTLLIVTLWKAHLK